MLNNWSLRCWRWPYTGAEYRLPGVPLLVNVPPGWGGQHSGKHQMLACGGELVVHCHRGPLGLFQSVPVV